MATVALDNRRIGLEAGGVGGDKIDSPPSSRGEDTAAVVTADARITHWVCLESTTTTTTVYGHSVLRVGENEGLAVAPCSR